MTTTPDIWSQFSDKLRGYIGKRVNNSDDADDILQDVFLKIHSKLDTLDDQSRIGPWVYRIAQNAVTDFYRKRAATPTVPGTDTEDPPAPSDDDATGIDLTPWLRGAIQELPDTYRDAIQLSEIDGLTQQAVADRLGLSLSGAKSRVQRGRQRIKEMLLACCHVELDRRGNIIDVERRSDCKFCQPGCNDDC